jgi:tetratricopeptide (TPR) repeat protein
MAEPGTTPPVAASAPPVPLVRRLVTSLPLAAVWLAALLPVAAWPLHRADPEAVVRLWLTAKWSLGLAAAVVAALALTAAALWPPFPAWLRLCWHHARLAVAADRGPLLKALTDLQHFATAPKHLEVGRLALQRGELGLAGPHLVRAVELGPDLAAARYWLGRLLLRAQRVRDALLSFRSAELLDPGHAFGDALLQAGRCCSLLGDHGGAVELLREHAGRHGGNRTSLLWLGDALAAVGERTAARAAWSEAAAPPRERRLTPEEAMSRATARVRLWRHGGRP